MKLSEKEQRVIYNSIVRKLSEKYSKKIAEIEEKQQKLYKEYVKNIDNDDLIQRYKKLKLNVTKAQNVLDEFKEKVLKPSKIDPYTLLPVVDYKDIKGFSELSEEKEKLVKENSHVHYRANESIVALTLADSKKAKEIINKLNIIIDPELL